MSENKLNAFKTIAGEDQGQPKETDAGKPATVQEVMENPEQPEDQVEEEAFEDSGYYTTDVK